MTDGETESSITASNTMLVSSEVGPTNREVASTDLPPLLDYNFDTLIPPEVFENLMPVG